MRRRVVITGMGLVSPLGSDPEGVFKQLQDGNSAVRHMPTWAMLDGLNTHVAASVTLADDTIASIPRTVRRGMGRQAIFAGLAAQDAVRDAGLSAEEVAAGRIGVAIGSTMGSATTYDDFYTHWVAHKTFRGVKSTLFFQTMGHSCAANVALLLGANGRVVAPTSACTSGSQSIGMAYEMILAGTQDAMICGGADELHPSVAAVFDIARGASTAYNDCPQSTPRPFDRDRDGLVVGEGAGIVVLERLEYAQARGAKIYAEVIGYASLGDGQHLSQPDSSTVKRCLQGALDCAGIAAHQVDYVNAHATGTVLGDTVEAQALYATFGDRVPISSTKGHIGHTLAACGGHETIFTVLMLKNQLAIGTKNLDVVDPHCVGPHLLQRNIACPLKIAINNNIAFGVVCTSLVLRAYQ